MRRTPADEYDLQEFVAFVGGNVQATRYFGVLRKVAVRLSQPRPTYQGMGPGHSRKLTRDRHA